VTSVQPHASSAAHSLEDASEATRIAVALRTSLLERRAVDL
jgi:hypothetical protein